MCSLKIFMALSEAASRDERKLFNKLHKRLVDSTLAELLLNDVAEQWRRIGESPETPIDKRMYAYRRYEFCAHPTTKDMVMARCNNRLK